jgi:hypothetical protein
MVGTAVTGNVSNGSASASYTVPGGTAVGSYTIQATFSGTANFNPSGDSSHTLTINSASTTTAASNAGATYSPSNQSITLSATVTSASSTVNAGTVIFAVFNGPTQLGSSTSPVSVSNGSASASYTLPGGTTVGSYSIVATYTGAGGFLPSSDSSHTLTVSKATPVITWPTPADIVFGGALSSVQLNASANVPGTLVYTPAAGAVLMVGNGQTLSVQFTPTDTVDYNATSQTVLINVTPAPVPATLILSETAARDSGTGNVLVTVTVANTGGTVATLVQLTAATLNSVAPISTLPAPVADVAPAGTSIVALTFPASVGLPGDSDILLLNGTYNAGSFGGNARITLP